MTSKEAMRYLAECYHCKMKTDENDCIDKNCFEAKVLALKALRIQVDKEKDNDK